MSPFEMAAQYGIAAVAILAAAVGLWIMYQRQSVERQKMMDAHQTERKEDELRHQSERQASERVIAQQHTEALEVTRQCVKTTTELITFLRAKIK